MHIDKPPADSMLCDVIGPYDCWRIPVGEHGFVCLKDCMPRMVPVGKTADFAIVQAARVSYGQGTKEVNEDRGLIRYLARHRHTTPFEMVEFKFHCAMPIFVARQWIRHRTANVNEYSARYSVVRDRFYRPDVTNIRTQSNTNKQGGKESVSVETAQGFLDWLDEVAAGYAKYESMIDKGISREQARIGLPVNLYTEWYWKIDLHNLFRFLSLRMDAHAQAEIQNYAFTMFELIKPIVPIAAEAFQDYDLGSINLSQLEVQAIRHGGLPITDNRRELAEFKEKMQLLNLGEKNAFTKNRSSE